MHKIRNTAHLLIYKNLVEKYKTYNDIHRPSNHIIRIALQRHGWDKEEAIKWLDDYNNWWYIFSYD